MTTVPANRIIIDTDPGVDDVIAILLALSANPEELEVLLFSVVSGNTSVENCLRNVVSIFHVIEQENKWREARGQPSGFRNLESSKPIVAIGADEPLEDPLMLADYYRKMRDLLEFEFGLTRSNKMASMALEHPHLSPTETWKDVFTNSTTSSSSASISFTPSLQPAHKEILKVLRENEPDTITILALGPMTNIALAAAEDPETFLRVKEVVAMNGAVDIEGNMTPVAEFNCYADAVATARVFALTSPTPSSTMPPIKSKSIARYPATLSRPLKLTTFPLEITTVHPLHKSLFDSIITPLVQAGSPLAIWCNVFISKTFDKVRALYSFTQDPAMTLHDSLCIWYLLSRLTMTWTPSPKSPEDIRVETGGQWCKGQQIIDRRDRVAGGTDDDIVGDTGDWLHSKKGNRVVRMIKSPGPELFAPFLLERIFGQ